MYHHLCQVLISLQKKFIRKRKHRISDWRLETVHICRILMRARDPIFLTIKGKSSKSLKIQGCLNCDIPKFEKGTNISMHDLERVDLG